MEEVVSCRYRHPALGIVHIRVHGTIRHISARWVGQEVHVTIPPGLSPADYDRFISSAQHTLLARRPALHFTPGQIIDAPDIDITLRSAKLPGRRKVNIDICTSAAVRGKAINYTVTIDMPGDEGWESAEAQSTLNHAVLTVASHATRELIVPEARRIAASLGCAPRAWAVKECKTRFGSCSSTGLITLSPRLIFMPGHLRRYIICHELAHLTEMNHSAAFHRLCNDYCGGHEAELRAELRRLRFPVF